MKYYTTQEIADILTLDVETIRRYIRDGQLSATKLGKEYRVSEKDFSDYMDERRKEVEK